MNYKELEKYILSLFTKYFNKYRMPLEDKQDIIQNVMLRLFLKEQEGVIGDSIEENKNYIFITIKNDVLQKVYPYYKINKLDPAEIEIPSNDPDILDLMDSKEKKDIVLSLMKNKSFNQKEIDFVNEVFKGNSSKDLTEKFNMTKEQLHLFYASIKLKIKHKRKRQPKYKVIFPTRDVYCFTQNELLQVTKISPDTWKQFIKLKKTNFPNFNIEFLKHKK